MNTEKEFELEFEKLKKETHERFKELHERFPNAINWKINFSYDWNVNCTSWIDEDNSGWYDKLKQDANQVDGEKHE